MFDFLVVIVLILVGLAALIYIISTADKWMPVVLAVGEALLGIAVAIFIISQIPTSPLGWIGRIVVLIAFYASLCIWGIPAWAHWQYDNFHDMHKFMKKAFWNARILLELMVFFLFIVAAFFAIQAIYTEFFGNR